MGTKFTIIKTGLWEVPRNEIIAPETPEIEAENRRLQIPGYCVLIDHPTLGKVLWDTGIAYDKDVTWLDEMKALYKFQEFYYLDEKLAELGLTVHDIDTVIVSHLHYDHSGNIKMFQNTKAGKNGVIISEAEAKQAFVKVNLDDKGYAYGYVKNEFLNLRGINYRLLEKDEKLADDVELIIQSGHTPGVIGLLVKTEKSGAYLFTSDAVYSKLNFGPPIVLPGICSDPESYKANIERLHKIVAKNNAQLFVGHDAKDFSTWNKSPMWYE